MGSTVSPPCDRLMDQEGLKPVGDLLLFVVNASSKVESDAVDGWPV